MVAPEIEPMDAELRDLLDAEAARPGPPDVVRSTVRGGVEAELSAASRLGRPSAGRAWTGTKVTGFAAAALALGIGLGAWGHARWGKERVVSVDRVVEVQAYAPPVLPALPSASATELRPPTMTNPRVAVPTATKSNPSPTATVSPRSDGTLGAERTLLERAREALARGDAADALDAVAAHERAFPLGQLAEEREVLAVQALARAGLGPQARARAAQFRGRFPESPLEAVVDATLRTIP